MLSKFGHTVRWYINHKSNISFTEALRQQTLSGIFVLGELDEPNETQHEETFVHKLEGQKKNFNNSREALLKIRHILLKCL